MTRRLLIVSSDSDLLERFSFEAERLKRAAPLCASTYESARALLQEHLNEVLAMVVSSSLSDEDIRNLVFAGLRAKPDLLVMLMADKKTIPFSYAELAKMKVSVILEPPITFRKIMSQVATTRLSQRAADGNLDPNFAPLKADAMAADESPAEDLYVRVRGDRYVKILHKGYSIGSNRLQNYLSRGLINFYLTKKA